MNTVLPPSDQRSAGGLIENRVHHLFHGKRGGIDLHRVISGLQRCHIAVHVPVVPGLDVLDKGREGSIKALFLQLGVAPAGALLGALPGKEFGNRRSCIDLARILYAMDDALPAEQIALAACVPGDPASAQVCAFGQRLQSLRRKAEAAREAAIQAARNAQAREQAVFEQYMGRRDYDGALYYSLYHLRSKSHAETAIMAAARAGALSTIFRDHFYVLEYWFPSGPVAQIAASQIAQIGQANDCGIWNCTNTPGASSARWRAAGGSSGSSYSRSSGSSFQPVRTPSSAEIAKQTRDKYRSYNCTGSRRLSSSHPACQ